MTEDPEHRLRCAERSCDVVGVFLVDAPGRVLLQERDEHAPVEANQWGMSAGTSTRRSRTAGEREST